MNILGGCKCQERERRFKSRSGNRSLVLASSGKINSLNPNLLVSLPFNPFCLKKSQICQLQTECLITQPSKLQSLQPIVIRVLKLSPSKGHSPLHSVPLSLNVVATVLVIARKRGMLTTLKLFRQIKP